MPLMRRIYNHSSYFVFIFFRTFLGNKLDFPFFPDNSPFLLTLVLARSFTGHPVLGPPHELITLLKQNRPSTKKRKVVFFFIVFIKVV